MLRQNYNSFKYWEEIISKNNTIRGHMLMDKLPTDKSIYMHTLIYCKDSGLNNVWSYFPNEASLLGYIQYSFLQEAFYIWINSRVGSVASIPLKSVEQVIKDGERNNRISKEEANNMRNQVNLLNKCWDMPKNRIIPELKKFVRQFNNTWYGDSTEFLYLKIFEKPEELGEFVLKSSYMTSSEEEFENKIGESIENWKNICLNSDKDQVNGKRFREILQKNLTEII